MPTWRADVFVNSRVGRITTEVDAATFSGAKEQIYAKHGDVQQITNLRQVSGGGSGGFSTGDVGGSLGGIALLILIFLAIEYWKWVVGIGGILVVLWLISNFIKD